MPYHVMMKDVQKVFPKAQIDFYLRKEGLHRMAEPQDLKLILNTLTELLKTVGYSS
jgi:hypothetical protein